MDVKKETKGRKERESLPPYAPVDHVVNSKTERKMAVVVEDITTTHKINTKH